MYSLFDRRLDPVRLFEEFDRLVGTARPAAAWPRLNLHGDDHQLQLEAVVPGADPSSLDLSVDGRTLTLSGSLEEGMAGEGACLARERGEGAFSRRVSLPYAVEPGEVSAKYEHGVLRVVLPRLHREKPRKISIETAR